jgi:hypothetical protein
LWVNYFLFRSSGCVRVAALLPEVRERTFPAAPSDAVSGPAWQTDLRSVATPISWCLAAATCHPICDLVCSNATSFHKIPSISSREDTNSIPCNTCPLRILAIWLKFDMQKSADGTRNTWSSKQPDGSGAFARRSFTSPLGAPSKVWRYTKMTLFRAHRGLSRKGSSSS